jgi:hypothetical protein
MSLRERINGIVKAATSKPAYEKNYDLEDEQHEKLHNPESSEEERDEIKSGKEDTAEDNTVKIPVSEFVDEHKRLVKVLQDKGVFKEAELQKGELEKEEKEHRRFFSDPKVIEHGKSRPMLKMSMKAKEE